MEEKKPFPQKLGDKNIKSGDGMRSLRTVRKPNTSTNISQKPAAAPVHIKTALPEENKEPVKKLQKPHKKKHLSTKTVLLRIALCAATALVILLVTVIVFCNVLLNGPSKTVRNTLVLSAKQASATKWMPAVFMDSDLVYEIEKDSFKTYVDVTPIHEYVPPEDEWANAVDGIIFKIIDLPTCRGYMVLIKDPSRVFVGISSDFTSGKAGMRMFQIVEKYKCTIAINGGEFPDPGGVGDGATPYGMTFSQGKNYWSAGGSIRTFIGFDKNNVLHVCEGMTLEKANELGIRDSVSFGKGNTLLTNDGNNLVKNVAAQNRGVAQRTAIGQRKDGTVIMIVTDGRSSSSIGATHDDIANAMIENGAIVAGMLDGGSSAMMYYRNWYDIYKYDKSLLDDNQKKGLVNQYKAFMPPRRLPTYFMVCPSES